MTGASTIEARRPEVACADWLEFVAALGDSTVDLLYVDPPFNTGQPQRSPINGDKRGRLTDATYADAFASPEAFIEFLRERLRATLRCLKPSASVLIHVDWRTSHHVRLMLDQELGEENFVNHLIWSYGLGGSSARRFARKHDDILFYAIDSEKYYFEPPMVEATSQRLKGKHKKMTDVLEIASLNNMAKERTGYPTQKPLELLEVLIGACSPPGGTVLDPCMGSGTTLVAAKRLGRRWLGCDVSEQAVSVARERLGE